MRRRVPRGRRRGPGAFAVAGVLGLALVASAGLGAARRGPPGARPAPVRPPGVDGAAPGPPAPLGTELWTNGQAVELEWREAPGRPDWEADRVATDLLAAHGAVERRRIEGGWHLSARAADGAVTSVLVLARPHGGSLVAAGVGRGALRPGAEAGRLGVPLLPDRRGLSSHAARDGAVTRIAVQHLTPRPPEEARAWYRARLAALGYRASPGPAGGDGVRLEAFSRGVDRVWLGAGPVAEGALVLLVREEAGR